MLSNDEIERYANEMRSRTKCTEVLSLKAEYEAFKAGNKLMTDDDLWHRLLAYERVLTPFGFVPGGNVWD